MTKKLWILALALVLVALAGCNSTNKSLVYAKSAPEGEEGMRVELKGGTFSGGAGGALENVGEFVKIPSLYKGAVPPGWEVYDQGAPPAPEPEVDEEATPPPPPE